VVLTAAIVWMLGMMWRHNPPQEHP
jgi:hypothetical protein